MVILVDDNVSALRSGRSSVDGRTVAAGVAEEGKPVNRNNEFQSTFARGQCYAKMKGEENNTKIDKPP